MPRQTDTPEDLSAFLSRPEDLARALDAGAAEERTRETLRKAAENANFAAAMKALEEGPKEEPGRAVQPSERSEYNPAKTIPPRTRRDTLELEPRLIVRSELLDSRHRPTAKIQREAAPTAVPPPDEPPPPTAASAANEATPEAQVASAPSPPSGTYSTLEGLGTLGVRPGDERDESAKAELPRDPSPDALAAPALAKTEPVAVRRDSAAPLPEASSNQALTVVTRPSNNRGRLIAFLLLSLLAVVAILLWNFRGAATDSQVTPASSKASAAPSSPPPGEEAAAPAASIVEVPVPPMSAGMGDPPIESASPFSDGSAPTRAAPPPRRDASARPEASVPSPHAATAAPPTAAPEKSSNRLGLPYDEKK